MKREYIFLIIGLLAASLFWGFFINNKIDKNYLKEIDVLNQIISDHQQRIIQLQKKEQQIINDYEKEIKHVNSLRDRIPTDSFIDSLLRAGQSIR